MGRETFLAKVTWENGWPVIAEGVGHLEDTLELPTKEYRFPEEVSSTSDHISFWEKKPDKRLVSVEEICEENYSLSHRPGMLRLYTKKEKSSWHRSSQWPMAGALRATSSGVPAAAVK